MKKVKRSVIVAKKSHARLARDIDEQIAPNPTEEKTCIFLNRTRLHMTVRRDSDQTGALNKPAKLRD